jgi:AraC-like DNA-binding protein
MKPAYEHVEFGEQCSVRIYHRRLPRIPFEWHHHPEYELTLTMNSHGKRYIGDAVATYEADDLVLVPPDLPHTWASNRSIDASQPQVAIVVWFDGEWARRLADCCPEYAPLRKLLRRAACGLAFEAAAGAAMRARLDALLSETPRTRLAATLDILCALAEAPGVPLASPSAFNARTAGASGHEPERLNRVLAMIDAQFAQPLRLADLGSAAGLSERTLARQFALHIGESVGRYIARVRIGHACRLLADTSLPVSVIAARSGFANVANFNRQFRAMKEMTPVDWRAQYAAGRTTPETGPGLTERSPSLSTRGGKMKTSTKTSRPGGTTAA